VSPSEAPTFTAAEMEIEIAANGLKFRATAEGPEDGPLALCLHGFPDSAHTWRYLLPELAAAGFRAVAPWMRGYAPTEAPADASYGVGALVADATALHEALGGDRRAVLIGHDWGAIAAYGAAGFAPDRWGRLVTLAIPPLAALMSKLFAYEQLKRSWYVYVFQTPIAETVVANDDMALIHGLWADWSPGYDATQDVAAAKEALRGSANRRAAIGSYRAMLGAEPPPDRDEAPAAAANGVAPQPTLFIHGDQDGSTANETYTDAASFLSRGSRVEIVRGTGHFLHVERPAIVNHLIVEWVTASR
jgi:pimeloyl-ACP methyl ester carboxylesterase